MRTKIRTRRDRNTEGGARSFLRGLGCGTALVTGPALAGPVVCLKARQVCFAMVSALALIVPVAVSALEVPSGQPIRPHDILWEDQGGQATLVLRMLAPEIARGGRARDYDEVTPDFDAICAKIGLPLVDLTASDVSHITVVLMDRPVDRGIPDTDATQFIAEFRLEDGRCMLEFF